MLTPPLPANESARLQALLALSILDTPAEERFDRLTRIAQQALGVPIALVSLIDAHRQWFKSRQGLEASETPREVSFCGHAILGDEPMVVNDALDDARFCDNPLVTGDPDVRFYAGVPLRGPQGHALGTLCVIDHAPRTVTPGELTLLRDLAAIVERELGADELARVTATLRARELELQEFLDSSHDLIQSIDADGALLMVNRRWRERLGYADALPSNIFDVIDPSEHAHCRAEFARLKEGGGRLTLETVFRTRSGEPVALEGRVGLSATAPLHTRGFFTDVTEDRRQRKQLTVLATTDELTNLSNRRFLREHLARVFASARRYDHPLAVALVDVDHFKRVNDEFGHDVGDRVLVQLGRHLVTGIRDADAVGRYGGEEFLLVMPATAADAATLLLDRLRQSLATVSWPADVPRVTFSAGVAGLSPSTPDFDGLVRQADVALYEAKHAGRDRVAVARAG